ncbi:MAG: biotin--[acetyl-CoA-carboxylase] ligase, partial [Angustibacter sp.]
MTKAFTDLDRPPLSAAALRRALIEPAGPWTSVRVVDRTGSTQADLLREVAAGQAAAGAVLIAEEQWAGAGRRGRSWVAPAQAGLSVSVVLRPQTPVASWSWLPLLAGL